MAELRTPRTPFCLVAETLSVDDVWRRCSRPDLELLSCHAKPVSMLGVARAARLHAAPCCATTGAGKPCIAVILPTPERSPSLNFAPATPSLQKLFLRSCFLQGLHCKVYTVSVCHRSAESILAFLQRLTSRVKPLRTHTSRLQPRHRLGQMLC